MRIVVLLAFGISISQVAFSQTWQPPQLPQAPQPATINVPIITTSSTLIEDLATSSSLVNSNAMAIYENDRRSVENEKLLKANERRMVQDDVNGAWKAHPGQGYASATCPTDPRAASYLQAYNELNNMLTGKSPASLKRAVFLVENAWFENKMNYDAYNQRISNLVEFARQKMKDEKTDTSDNEVKNNMLFRLLSEPLTVTDPRTKKKITSTPLHYDFEDFYGRKDWSKMFVTKLLNTGYGQCHSMPLLYNILAQEIGAQAYMSFSPSHCFAKYKSGNTFKNVELTNGHITSDAWVLASGMVKAEALKSHIYLDTVGLRQQIAYMMQDLASGYLRKFGYDYFVGMCNETGLKYYPNNAYGLALKANYITDMFKQSIAPYGNTPPQQVLSVPGIKKLYDAMQASYAALDQAGYAEMHPEEYEDWLKSADQQKRKQEYELFLRYQKTHKSMIGNVTH